VSVCVRESNVVYCWPVAVVVVERIALDGRFLLEWELAVLFGDDSGLVDVDDGADWVMMELNDCDAGKRLFWLR